MVNDVLARVDANHLRAYVVWMPVLDADDLDAARAASRAVTDPRVTQYWDEGLHLGFALGESMRIPVRPRIGAGRGLAWDVYLVYPPGAVVGDAVAPPVPEVWMHQLSHLPEGFAPRLDAAALEARLEEAALAAPSSGSAAAAGGR